MSLSVAEYGGGKIPGRQTYTTVMNLKEWKEQDLKIEEGPVFSLHPSALQKCTIVKGHFTPNSKTHLSSYL